MAKVAVIGESWFTYSVHQKGFDAFYTSEYIEGCAEFLAALTATGHEVTYIPSHEIHRKVPDTLSGLREIADVVIISDVGANSFQLAPETFTRSVPSVDKTDLIREFVAGGGGLVMIGGYLTFTGIDAKARWGATPLAAALPVTLSAHDDRMELPAGATPTVAAEHAILSGLPRQWPALLGLNRVEVKKGSTLLAECAEQPLLVTGTYGEGRSAVFTSDIAPHWAPPSFVSWDGYPVLFDRLVRWVSGGDLP